MACSAVVTIDDADGLINDVIACDVTTSQSASCRRCRKFVTRLKIINLLLQTLTIHSVQSSHAISQHRLYI